MFVTKVQKIGELPEKLKNQFLEVVKLHGGDEESEFIRKSGITQDDMELGEAERTCVQYVSTADIDRDGEILVPSGGVLTEFRKAPQVLWGHDYNLPPIGKDLWIRSTQKGIIAKTQYATTERANEIWELKKGGFLKTNSVGFMPIKYTKQGDDDWDKLCDKLHGQGYTFDRTKVRKIYTKWVLLEHSDVSVPANINALVVAVSKKSLSLSDELINELGIAPSDANLDNVIKGVIPYKDYGILSDMEAEWDAGREVRQADTTQLMKMCAWYDSGNPEVKQSYKLPHHRASDSKLVWRGLTAAMAVLLGARGGVDVPGGDRPRIYTHLSKHYAQFDKEPPAFRAYSDLELRGLFGTEIWEQALLEIFPALKPYPNEHACRILSPDGFDEIRRENNRFGDGIHALWGIKTNEPVKLQALRFDKTKFTPTQAKTWCSEHDYSCNPFEPASESRAAKIAPVKPVIAAKKVEPPPKPQITPLPKVAKIGEEKIVKRVGRAEVPDVYDVDVQTLEEEIQQALGRAKGKV